MIKKLKDLGTLKVPNRIKYSEGSKYNVADITAIDIHHLFLKDYKKTDDKTNLLKKNDLAIISFDYSGNALGHALYIDKNYKYVAGIDTIIFTESKINSKALAIYLDSFEVKKQINRFSNTALTTSKRISINHLKEIEIDIFKVKEIEKKLLVFEKFDLFIEEYWESILNINSFYNETKKNIFSRVNDWEKRNITDFCNLKSGAEIRPKNINQKKTNSFNIPVISGTSGIIGYTDKANSLNKYVLYVSRGGNCGNALFIDEKSYVINKMIMIETKHINPIFLSYQLQFFKPGIEGGGLTKYVSLDNLKKANIYIPNKKEQDEIVKVLNNFEKYIENKNKYFENLLNLKKELLRQI